jgi:KDO2-lipid IV(A) lauroyltransferase
VTARRLRFLLRRALIEAGGLVLGVLVWLLYSGVRAVPKATAVRIGSTLARRLGPLTTAHRVGLDNLRHALPELPAAEHRRILANVWDNLGRTVVEYVHLDEIWDARVVSEDPLVVASERFEIVGAEHFARLRDDGRPAVIVSAHLGNWELPMISAATHGLKAAALFRAPNNRWIARWVLNRRKLAMGELIAARPGAYQELNAVLERGDHLGLLVDQRFGRGIVVPFFGRPALANPTFARLLRRFDCPAHAVRVSRLPGDRFRIELTPELDLPRGPDGLVDIDGATAAVARLFEGWIREDPSQWLWLHRRWRL